MDDRERDKTRRRKSKHSCVFEKGGKRGRV
jgi:hypothetical protein